MPPMRDASEMIEAPALMGAPGVSLLRASLAARLGLVGVVLGVLWLAVVWALS